MSLMRTRCDCSCQQGDVLCSGYTCPPEVNVSYQFPSASIELTEGADTCTTTLKSISDSVTLFTDVFPHGYPCEYRGVKTKYCVPDLGCMPEITTSEFNTSCWVGDEVFEQQICNVYEEPQQVDKPYWGFVPEELRNCDCIEQTPLCSSGGYCIREPKDTYHRYSWTAPVKPPYTREFYCGCGQVGTYGGCSGHVDCCGCPCGSGDTICHCAGECGECRDTIQTSYRGAVQRQTTCSLKYVTIKRNAQPCNAFQRRWYLFLGTKGYDRWVHRQTDCEGNWGTPLGTWSGSASGDSTCCENTREVAWDIDHMLGNPVCWSGLDAGQEAEPTCRQYVSNPDFAGVHYASRFGSWWALPNDIVDCQDLDGVSLLTSGVELAQRYCPYPYAYPTPVGSARGGFLDSSPSGFEASSFTISI